MNPFKRFFLPLAWIVPPIAGVMAVPFMLGGEEYRIHWGTLTAAFASHWIVICYLIWFLLEPKVSGYQSPKPIRLNAAERILVVANAEWLGQGVGVTVFEKTEGYERQVALGEVYNVQQDGLVQIRLIPFDDDSDGSQMSSQLAKVGSSGLTEIVIKPGPLRNVI